VVLRGEQGGGGAFSWGVLFTLRSSYVKEGGSWLIVATQRSSLGERLRKKNWWSLSERAWKQKRFRKLGTIGAFERGGQLTLLARSVEEEGPRMDRGGVLGGVGMRGGTYVHK